MATTRQVSIGGTSKVELQAALAAEHVAMNATAEQLFASSLFTVSPTPSSLPTLQCTVREVGCPDGATMPEIIAAAGQRGLAACPAELGPHLRLQYLDQPEGRRGKPVLAQRAPYGSVTIVSNRLSDDDTFPRGFYLRRIDDVLWLRGYRSNDDHVWDPDDQLVFTGDPSCA